MEYIWEGGGRGVPNIGPMDYIWDEKGVSQYRTNGIYLGRGGGRGVPNIGPMDYIWEEGVSQYRTNGLYLGGEGSFPI